MSNQENEKYLEMVDEFQSEQSEEFEDQIDFGDPGLMAAAEKACKMMQIEHNVFNSFGIIL